MPQGYEEKSIEHVKCWRHVAVKRQQDLELQKSHSPYILQLQPSSCNIPEYF